MKYSHIIWDWNGTLLDDVELCVSIMNEMLANNNLEGMTIEKYKEIFTFPVIDYYVKLGFRAEDFEEVGARFIANYEKNKDKCGIFQGARELLKKNSENGVSQSILSAYKQSTLVELVAQHGLSKYFVKLAGHRDIYASGKLEQGKSLIAELEIDKDKTILIGDTYHDYEVAEALGIDCILMSLGHASLNNLKKATPNIAKDFAELDLYLWG